MPSDDASRDSDDADGSDDDGLPSPGDALTNPADNVPTPRAPEVGTDAPAVPEPEDVPEGLRAEFWELVVAANVALFALALGAMLVGFDQNVPLGALSLAVGVAAAVFFAYRYRNRQHTP